MSCVAKTRWSRSQAVRCCSRSHVRSAKRGPQICRGMRSSSEHSVQSTPMNRIAHACEWRLGGFAPSFDRSRASSATPQGFALAPRSAREVVVLAPPVEDQHAAVIAFLADGESWSSSALALALGASARTVQRALDSLASGRQGAVLWSRASTPLDDRARAGIHDNLVTPRSTAERLESRHENISSRNPPRVWPFSGRRPRPWCDV